MSSYNGDKTWEDVSNRAGAGSRNMISALTRGTDDYNEWQSFRAGRTNAQIATALSRTEAEIADLDACYSAFLEIFNYANNDQSPFSADRFFSMRKFS